MRAHKFANQLYTFAKYQSVKNFENNEMNKMPPVPTVSITIVSQPLFKAEVMGLSPRMGTKIICCGKVSRQGDTWFHRISKSKLPLVLLVLCLEQT